MRALHVVAFVCACASAPPPASETPEDPPPGSHAELLRVRDAPAALAELDDLIRRLTQLAARAAEPGPLLLRLADALQQRAAAHGRAEAVALEEGFEHRGDPDARAAADARARRHAESRVADLEAARRTLESIDSGSPQAEDAREARFWLLTERREWEAESLAAARAVLQTATEGPLVAAAHLRLAEHAFVEAELGQALDGYERVLATAGADAQSRAHASYKRAWVLYNLGRFEEAERAFGATIAIARGTTGGEQLVREAAKDRVRVHVPLRSSPERVLTAITESTDDVELRATLVQRYEQQLRDAGMLAEADAFRAAVLR